jgi:hypothetical protein
MHLLVLWYDSRTIVTLLVYNVMSSLRNDCPPINATRAQALYELTNPSVGAMPIENDSDRDNYFEIKQVMGEVYRCFHHNPFC